MMKSPEETSSASRLVCGKRSFRNLKGFVIGELLVDLFCECRSCFVVRCFGFEKFQYTNATGLVYFHMVAELVWTLE